MFLALEALELPHESAREQRSLRSQLLNLCAQIRALFFEVAKPLDPVRAPREFERVGAALAELGLCLCDGHPQLGTRLQLLLQGLQLFRSSAPTDSSNLFDSSSPSNPSPLRLLRIV